MEKVTFFEKKLKKNYPTYLIGSKSYLGTLKEFEFLNGMPIKVTNCRPPKIDPKIKKNFFKLGGG
jgi:hypothetical protein